MRVGAFLCLGVSLSECVSVCVRLCLRVSLSACVSMSYVLCPCVDAFYGFINIKDMYNNDVGKGGARVYEAYEVPFYFINSWLIPDRHRYCTHLYYLCVSVCVHIAYKQKRGHVCP